MSRQQVKASYDGQRAKRPYTDKNRTYVEGNTVRRMEAAPNHLPREEEKRRKEQKERERRANRAARLNRQKAMQMGPGYVLFLTVAVLMTVGVCMLYVQLQSDINGRMKNVAALESQILDLRTDNDAALRRIETSVDMEGVRNKALNEMGMKYPSQDQIIYYDVDANDYMNQYQDIPEK